MAGNIIKLIRKDIYVLWSEKKTGFIFMIYVSTAGAIFASMSNFMGQYFAFIIAAAYISNLAGLDEKYRAERFFASLPVQRSEIVFARYCGILAITGIYILMVYIANEILIYITKTRIPPTPVVYLASLVMIISLLTSCSYPVYFKYGFAKARAVIMFFFFVVFALMMIPAIEIWGISPLFMRSILNILESPYPQDITIVLQLTALCVLLLSISIMASVGGYSKKDL